MRVVMRRRRMGMPVVVGEHVRRNWWPDGTAIVIHALVREGELANLDVTRLGIKGEGVADADMGRREGHVLALGDVLDLVG